jgi:pimeloyl-ACP methyl ester carboxylesterase
MAYKPGSLGKDPPGAPLISLSPALPIRGQHPRPRQTQHRSTSHHQERKAAVNIIQGMRLSRMRIVLIAVVLAVAGLLVSASQIGPAGAATAHAAEGGPKPTIVLEHGGWADASSWTGEIKRLQADGYTVDAPPNPLRGLANDSATLADFLSTITGPIVLVGHSYGGMVITNAAAGNPNVKALVYVDAFIPAQGETTFGLTFAQPGSCVGSANAFNAVPYPGAAPGDFDAYLKAGPDAPYPGFARCFANGLPASQAAVLAATQRPIAFSAGSDPSGVPAWLTIPSWSLIGTVDHVIPPAELLFMSQRAHAHITEIKAGHLSLISHPAAVTRVIIAAAQATG